MTFYRIFYRRRPKDGWMSYPSEIAEGEAERDRILARPRPKAVHWEVAVEHECSICRLVRPWEEGWTWFGAMDDVEQRRPIVPFCPDHRPKEQPRRPGEKQPWREQRRLHGWEPDHDGKVSARWALLRDLTDPNRHRKVPMPDWPGPGSCRWCLKPTIFERGKKKGQPAPTRNWHNACYYQYRLHTELGAQYDFCFDRDGPSCQICGDGRFAPGHCFATISAPYTALKASIVLEVDHVVPLWRADEFTAALAERRRLYGPDNLWLLCVPCHKRKTAIEAAERAAIKRSTSTSPPAS